MKQTFYQKKKTLNSELCSKSYIISYQTKILSNWALKVFYHSFVAALSEITHENNLYKKISHKIKTYIFKKIAHIKIKKVQY